MQSGRTIASRLFLEAMKSRANELEEDLKTCSNELEGMKLKLRIKNLQPRRFFEGSLVFGLQHAIVQEKAYACLLG